MVLNNNHHLLFGWEFPKTDWGTESGKNDPGIETFRGNPYPSVTREPIQNSVDAHNKKELPARVEFSLLKIPSKLFPGRDEYISILKKCIKQSKTDSDTHKELTRALETIEAEELFILKISDYNTTGLPGSEQLRNSHWHRLIKVVGESDKEDTSGGAFGIGKYATFVCSRLKAVFYATLDENKEAAFQGVAKLISFEDKDGEPYQATGFYGKREKKQPIKDMGEVQFLQQANIPRTQPGTDLFIMGFDYRETWADEIKEAAINSFFSAIHHGSLEVVVDGVKIERSTLATEIQKMKDAGSKSSAIQYFEVLTDPESKLFTEKDFSELGEVKLYVGLKNHYNKKTAMIRKTGMLIKEKPNYHIPMKYAAVLLINGTDFNKELKRVENPTHTDWELKRKPKPNVKIIKKALEDLSQWINNSINSISPYEDVKSLNVDELAEYLPDNTADEIEMIDLENLSTDGEPGNPIKSKIKRKSKSHKPLNVTDWGDDEESTSDTKEDTDENPGANPGPEPRPGTEPRPGPEPVPEPVPEPEPVPKPEHSEEKLTKARILKSRVFCINPNTAHYRINFDSNNEGMTTISFNILGEDSDIPAEIAKATIGNTVLSVKEDTIGPLKVVKGNNVIEFELVEKLRVALGVNFNGK